MFFIFIVRVSLNTLSDHDPPAYHFENVLPTRKIKPSDFVGCQFLYNKIFNKKQIKIRSFLFLKKKNGSLSVTMLGHTYREIET